MFPWVMVRREISKIIREDYGNYEGKLQKQFQPVHKFLRQAKGDSWFLNYLKYRRIENPKPKYTMPDLGVFIKSNYQVVDFLENPCKFIAAIDPYSKGGGGKSSLSHDKRMLGVEELKRLIGFEAPYFPIIFHEPDYFPIHSTARGKVVACINHDPKLLSKRRSRVNWDRVNRDITDLSCKHKVDPDLLPVLYRGPAVTVLPPTALAEVYGMLRWMDYLLNKNLSF
jgi:hypothetical protein